LRDQGVGVKVIVISDSKCETDPVSDGEVLLSTRQIAAGMEEL
jgi:hypothetical protein